jgi:hypothetical protein
MRRPRTHDRRGYALRLLLFAVLCAAALVAKRNVAWGGIDRAGAPHLREGLTNLRQDTIVVRIGQPTHPQTASLVENLVIGRDDATDEYRFTSVSNIATGRDGSIYIIDLLGGLPPIGLVRKFSRTGTYLRTFGRPGQGPGEIRGFPLAVQETGDGRVWVIDDPFVRVFDSTGKHVADYGPLVSPGSFQAFTHLDSHGLVYLFAILPPATLNGARQRTWIRLTPDGNVVDSIPSPIAQATFRSPVPFVESDVSSFSPEGY